MDKPGFKEVTIFDILCLFYGVLLGFYFGICKQCKQPVVQYTAQDNGIMIRQNAAQDNGMIIRQTFNSVVQPIKYDRSDLLSWAKYRKFWVSQMKI